MQDRKPYPHSSLFNIVAATQCFLHEKGRPDISFFDVKVDLLQKPLDARMKVLLKGLVLKNSQHSPEFSE